MDAVKLGYGLPAVFCTNPDYGMIEALPDGRLELRKKKLFNLARRRLNFGCSIFRVLRHAPWENPVRFDIDDPRYPELFREFVDILHQPYQRTGFGQGADVWLEPFDGCGAINAGGQTTLDKEWIFRDEARVRRTLGFLFDLTADKPFVKIGSGNEIPGTLKQCLRFHEIVFEEFKAAGRVPFSFGAVYSTTEDNLEHVKKMAGEKRFWGDYSNKMIFREVHKVGDSGSRHLVEVVEQWGDRPIRFALQADGIKPRPNIAEWISVLRYVFKNIKTKNLQIRRPVDSPLKIIFELFGEVSEVPDPNAVLAAASEVYADQFGRLPVNYGKYLDDYVEPEPEPETVLVELCRQTLLRPNAYCPEKEIRRFRKGDEPADVCPVHKAPELSCYEKYIADRPASKWQVGKYLSCLLGG